MYVILNVMLDCTIVFTPESYSIYEEHKSLISVIDFAQISMNVQVAQPTTATKKQTVITMMVHFAARVQVVSLGTVSATATVY